MDLKYGVNPHQRFLAAEPIDPATQPVRVLNGKTSFINRVTNARNEIASYPFTTLHPNLGIAELPAIGSSRRSHRRIVFADLPGLIEGAAGGAGLGARFLRHVERTKLLVHLIDVDPPDGSDPVANYHAIRAELAGYSTELASKPEIIAISKMDLLPTDDDRAAAVELIEGELSKPTFAISSSSRLGLDELLEACWQRLGKQEEESGVKWQV